MKSNNRLWSIAGLLLTFFLAMDAVAETEYRVRSADTVSRVVTKFYSDSAYPRSQIMVAILAKNPRAFSGGNINILLKGKRLRLPSNTEISKISHSDSKRLINQHIFLYRSGVTGQLNAPTISFDSESTRKKVKKQSQKISQLKQESTDLRKQLDNLFSEKKQRDQELSELEEKIKSFSLSDRTQARDDSPNKGKTAIEIESHNKKLRENNDFLQKKLVETKSELAENARSTMTLERKLSNLRETVDETNNVDKSGALSSLNNQGTAGENTTVSFQDKYAWLLLPVLLLVGLLFLLWLLARWFIARGRTKKVVEEEIDYEKDYTTLIEDYESTDYLNPENNEVEEALEASIKLDVARAYIEADDTESAMNILDEVMKEGTDGQKKEAQKIIAYLERSD